MTRHRLVDESLEATQPTNDLIAEAKALEMSGNWYSAGEKYIEVAEHAATTEDDTRAKLFVRAANCFDISCQARAAARAYSQAAAILERTGTRFVDAGELHNRSALHFRNASEFFNAGNAWRRAAAAFESASEPILTNLDNLSPVPSSAGKFTVAGNCYTAAGDTFKLAGDEAMWACGAYWEAGRSHQKQGYGYHAYIAYRKALAAVARFYQTHDRQKLSSCLPLSEEERATNLDPLSVMEKAASQGNHLHQSRNGGMIGAKWAQLETERQIISAYHEFALTFVDIGNGVEAAKYRALKKDRVRRLMRIERRYGPAVAYWIWAITSGYGESLIRWVLSCAVVLLSFSLIYAKFGLLQPVRDWFDYIYFSVVTFTSLGYGDIHPIGVAGKAAACAEIIFGLIMFGILLTFISNRFQRS